MALFVEFCHSMVQCCVMSWCSDILSRGVVCRGVRPDIIYWVIVWLWPRGEDHQLCGRCRVYPLTSSIPHSIVTLHLSLTPSWYSPPHILPTPSLPHSPVIPSVLNPRSLSHTHSCIYIPSDSTILHILPKCLTSLPSLVYQPHFMS